MLRRVLRPWVVVFLGQFLRAAGAEDRLVVPAVAQTYVAVIDRCSDAYSGHGLWYFSASFCAPPVPKIGSWCPQLL
ncbi:hypothetical protein C7D74_33015, partial [Klebsiella pneumoniae]